MTIGTAIVISIAIVCVTFFGVVCVGASMQKKKSDAAASLTNTISEELKKKLHERMNK